ncbi:MAG: hypothetical protein HY924_15555 [Elusimicrobia bacterium]|nr:hypothetical protein [Elusimicrobiota bacterium]
MRTPILIAMMLTWSVHAKAEFVVVQGTLTVQGNAFSVGNSSFVVLGSSIGIRTTQPAMALDVNGGAQFGAGAKKSTFSITGALNLASDAAFTASGPAGNIVSGASVTASAFFGNGSQMSGIAVSNSSSIANGFSSSTTTYDDPCHTCVEGSSISLTVAADSRLRISLAGNWHCHLSYPRARLLLNGSAINPLGTGQWTGNYDTNAVLSFSILTESLTSGQKDVCLAICAGQGYTTYWGTAVGDHEPGFSNTSPMVMTIEEVR